MPMLIPFIYKIKGDECSIMKKGNKYNLVSFGQIRLKDVLQFTAPCSLSKYLKQWGAEEIKSVFPYEFYKSIEEIEKAKTFPPYEAFFSTLKNENVSEDQYRNAKQLFDFHCSLPVGHQDRWESMTDFLKYYNLLDVRPLVDALVKSFEAFESHFAVKPNMSHSLPSLAYSSMFKLYDTNAELSYSFQNDQVRSLFRNNAIGGLTTVSHRHVNLSDDDSPHNSRFAPNGDRFTSVNFWDFNR